MGSTRKLKGWDGRTGSDLIAECASDEWRIYEREYGGVRWCEIKEPKPSLPPRCRTPHAQASRYATGVGSRAFNNAHESARNTPAAAIIRRHRLLSALGGDRARFDGPPIYVCCAPSKTSERGSSEVA
jgi:hypothetical protein